MQKTNIKVGQQVSVKLAEYADCNVVPYTTGEVLEITPSSLVVLDEESGFAMEFGFNETVFM